MPVTSANSRYFSETKHTVSDKFLTYWNNNGGLPVFGYPITEAQNEVDPETGKVFLTQWFERNRFELHPENAGTKYEVELGLLGKDLRREALAVDPDFASTQSLYDPNQPKDQQWFFSETGHNLRFQFLHYWLQNGGLERFGYPISEEHYEVDPETGKLFIMQWFERARFEYHPENNGTPYVILLGLLGNQLKTPKTPLAFAWKLDGKNPSVNPKALVFDYYGDAFVGIDRTIEKYDRYGRFLTRWRVDGDVVALAVDKQNEIYALTINGGGVYKYDFEGNQLALWGGNGVNINQFNNASGLALDAQNNVYVADTRNNRIQKFDGTGKFLTQWVSESPTSIAVSQQGHVYVTSTILSLQPSPSGILEYDTNGNYLGNFVTVGNTANQIQNAVDVAIDNQGVIYITNSTPYNCRIQKYDTKATNLGTIAVPSCGNHLAFDSFNNIYHIELDSVEMYTLQTQKWQTWGSASVTDFIGAIASDGLNNLYISNDISNTIIKLNSKGQLLAQFYGGSLTDATKDGNFNVRYSYSLTADQQGNFYILDSLSSITNAPNIYYRLQQFDSNGQFVRKIATFNNNSPSLDFSGPQQRGLAVDNQGNFYIFGTNQILKLDSQGRLLLKMGSVGNGPGQFYEPSGIAVDSQNNIYVGDLANHRIVKFDSAGHFLTEWGHGGNDNGAFEYQSGIAIDRQNNVYVADTLNHRIEIFDSNGKFLGKWASFGSGSGQFDSPIDIVVDKQGGIYVSDNQHLRLQKFIGLFLT
jgi:sugar lactone lactonase YvrE